MTTSSIFVWTSRWLKAQNLNHEAHLQLPSTNDRAKSQAFDDPPLKVYLAEIQTEGRGRGDHTWTSPQAGSSLLATWSFELAMSPQHLTAPLTGLHLYRACHVTWPQLSWSLKAPNDIYLLDRKVGGILVETISRGDSHRLLIGFGFNVLQSPLEVPGAGCVQDQMKEKITEVQWEGFLNHAHRGLRAVAQDCALAELPSEVRKSLLEALKAHPAAQDLKDVSRDGDLIFTNRTTAWHSL